jgi:tetratricopeptide (TPR) repeat protein
MEEKDLGRAIADYNRAIALYGGGSAQVYCDRGKAYTMLRDYGRAIADHCKAIQLDPSYAEAYFARGLAHDLRRSIFDKGRAVADYRRALRLDSAHAYARERLARLGAWP